MILYASRIATHESTKESSAFVLFGRDLAAPIDLSLKLPTPVYADTMDYKLNLFYKLPKIWDTVREHLIEAKAKEKRYYDQHVHLPPQYKPGDRVYYHVPFNKKGRTPKLAHQWWPFRILKISEPNAWIVSCSNPKAPPRFIHLNQLKAASHPHMTPLSNPTENVLENSLESTKFTDENSRMEQTRKSTESVTKWANPPNYSSLMDVVDHRPTHGIDLKSTPAYAARPSNKNIPFQG